MKEITSAEFEKEVEQDTPENNPKAQKEYTFNFNWTDGRGKLWRGEFTNKILNIGERSLVGNMRARLAGGLAANALDILAQEINYMLAHLAFSLVTKPDWAKELQELDDVRLLQEIYEEVSSHEVIFLGYGASSGAS